jgi:hypothetical protein
MVDMLMRRHQDYAVGYRIKANDWEVEADTAQEVASLLRILDGSGGEHADRAVQIEQGPKHKPWTAFKAALLEEKVEGHLAQQSLLWHLASLEDPECLYKEDLAKHFKMSTQQLGGVLSGLAKNAKKIGAEPLFFIEKMQRNGKRTCRYRLNEEFRQHFKRVIERKFQKETEPERTYEDPPVPRSVPNGAPVPNGGAVKQ